MQPIIISLALVVAVLATGFVTTFSALLKAQNKLDDLGYDMSEAEAEQRHLDRALDVPALEAKRTRIDKVRYAVQLLRENATTGKRISNRAEDHV